MPNKESEEEKKMRIAYERDKEMKDEKEQGEGKDRGGEKSQVKKRKRNVQEVSFRRV